MGIEGSPPPSPTRARRQLVLVAATVAVLFGATVIFVSLWAVTRLADPPTSASPLELARKIRTAHLGCQQPFIVSAADDLTIDGSQDEVDCGSGSARMVITRFGNRSHPERSMSSYLCQAADVKTQNDTYVLMVHSVVYPASPSAVQPIASAVHGRVVTACRR